jgi:plastocyanin
VDNEDDGYDEQFDDELDDDDEAPKKKKRVATSTKIVLVVAGWILLTLFLVGEFSENKNKPNTASAELQTTTPEFDDGGTPDIVDTEAEAEFDLDGDGFLDETERTAAIEAFEASVEAGEVAIGESDVSDSEGGGTGAYPGPDGETAETAVPGAAPSSGGSATNTTTTTAKPSGGGGGSPTTTAPAPTTTKPGAPAPTTTTTPPTTAPPPPPGAQPTDNTIVVTGTPGAFVLEPRDLSIVQGSRVRMQNLSNKDHKWKVGNRDEVTVDKAGGVSDYQVFNTKGTISYRCTIHPGMDGTITVS